MTPPRRYFSAPRLDRAADRREDPGWLEASSNAEGSLALLMCEGRIALRQAAAGAELAWLPMAVVPDHGYRAFLGLESGGARFAVAVDQVESRALATAHGLEFRGLRTVATLLDTDQAGTGAYARALDLWQRSHRYCGACGSETVVDQGGFRRRCRDCGRSHFPRIDPAVIVSVRDGPRCLLGRQRNWPENRYSVLAGFVEPGETLEATVAREVAEETGVRVTDVRYRGSQPWPFPSSLMIGFTARATTTRIAVGAELEDARWFSPDELQAAQRAGDVVLPPALSISRFLIDEWLADGGGRPAQPGGAGVF